MEYCTRSSFLHPLILLSVPYVDCIYIKLITTSILPFKPYPIQRRVIMLKKLLILFAIVLFCELTEVHSLQCYECRDCSIPSSNDLKTCEDYDTTTTSTTTPTPGSNQTITTLIPNNETTTTPTPGNNETATTEKPSDNVTNSVQYNAEGEALNDYIVKRVRRDSEDQKQLQNDCPCVNGKCDCNGGHTSRANEYSSFRATSAYQCYKLTLKENGTDVVYRGCLPRQDSVDPCKDRELNSENTVKFCGMCNEDKCNSAFTMRISIFVIVPVFSVWFI